jgi:DNA mismatch repair protein MutL
MNEIDRAGMASIVKLPDIVANKISAGEVVQRPASVVKELLENSIDAGASKITIAIKDAGKQLIQVIDNGSGMTGADALLCVERFATSKISGVEDLDALGTLGFRGEALASISSVAHFELKTRKADDLLGTLLKYDGGIMTGQSPVQSEQGTMITVRNLFFNVPARRKFLKTNPTEFRHIFETVKALTLAYPEIEWRMLSDDEELFHFRTSDVRERLNVFYGQGFGDSLIEISEENDFLSVGGYFGKPAMMKRQKYDQYFYVNRRIVQNRMLSQAVQQAYGELLEDRQAAFVLLFLGLEPQKVDVNVHPAKLEVRFEDERSIRNMVYPVIKRAIQTYDFSPETESLYAGAGRSSGIFISEEDIERTLAYASVPGKTSTTKDLYRNYQAGAVEHPQFGGSSPGPQPGFMPRNDDEPEPMRLAFHEGSEPIRDMDAQRLREVHISGGEEAEPKIWQLHNKYIMCQIKTGLMIIDQHVAHERVLYERAVDVMNEHVPNSQQLLFPQKIDLKPWQYEIYEEIKDDIYRLGFNIRAFGGSAVMIEGVPQDVRHGTESTILQDMIAEYQENASKLKLEKRDNLAKSYSCRNAVMTGQKLSLDEMRMMIDKLFATRMPYVCPHGRPVIIRLSLDELDRMFGRK